MMSPLRKTAFHRTGRPASTSRLSANEKQNLKTKTEFCGGSLGLAVE
jgi:hypothetical protein